MDPGIKSPLQTTKNPTKTVGLDGRVRLVYGNRNADELLAILEALDDTGRAALLAVARGLAATATAHH